MNADKRRRIFATLAGINPEPTTELNFRNPFELLIAVLLSAQATDISVNQATRTLFAEAPDPQSMVDLGVDRIRQHIRHIGLFNNKAKNVLATSQILLDQYSGAVPEDRAALEALPGVGRKTANVVLNTAFGHPTIAVDTHIFRVSNRTRIAHGKTVLEVEKRLLRVVPEEFRRNAHHWLILHGRYICKARTPECWRCPIAGDCEYKQKTTAPRRVRA